MPDAQRGIPLASSGRQALEQWESLVAALLGDDRQTCGRCFDSTPRRLRPHGLTREKMQAHDRQILSPPSSKPSRTCAPASSSSSWTTRIARTRATSSSARREGDARGDQLHGAGGPRAHLPRPDRGALRRARTAADGHGEHVQLRHRVHGLDRGAGPDDDGHLGRGPGGDGVDGDRSRDAPVGSEPAGPHVSAAGPAGRRAEARRPDRGLRGPGADRGPRSRRPSSARS